MTFVERYLQKFVSDGMPKMKMPLRYSGEGRGLERTARYRMPRMMCSLSLFGIKSATKRKDTDIDID